MGGGTSFLDLLCNGIGAAMLILVLVASKHFVRPELPVQGVLLVEVRSADHRAEVGLWMKRADGAEEFETKDFVEDDSRSGMFPPGLALVWVDDAFNADSSRSAIAVLDPQEGCYEVGVFVKDYDGRLIDWPEGIDADVRVEFRGATLVESRLDTPPGFAGAEGEALRVRLGLPSTAQRLLFNIGNPQGGGLCI